MPLRKITEDSMPLVGSKITDGKRLMEVEEIDPTGAYWLSDASKVYDPEKPSIRVQVTRESLKANWEKVVVPRDLRAAA